MRITTTLTRRSLLRAGAAATAATLVGIRPWTAAAAASAGHLLRSSYAGLEGQSFTIGSVELRLLSVSDVAGAAVDASLAGSEDAFALAFSGPLEAGLSTGAHALTHPTLGTFELFVSPVEQPRADRRYEAVVDRSVGASRSASKRLAAAAPPASADVSCTPPITPRARPPRAPPGARATPCSPTASRAARRGARSPARTPG